MGAANDARPAGFVRPARRLAAGLLIPALIGLAGAWIGMSVAGSHTLRSGPFTLRLSSNFGPGETTVSLPPLGRLSADTHVGPLQVAATLSSVDAAALVDYVQSHSTDQVVGEVRSDVLHAMAPFAWHVLLAGLAGALLLALVAYRRRWRRVAVAMIAALVAVGGGEALAWGTYRPTALLSPTYSGSLALAPGLIGPIRTATDRINSFSGELQRILDGTTRVFTRITSNPLITGDEIRVLHISDIHLSPLGMQFALEIARSFDVDLVMDTGDLTSFGTPVENLITSSVPLFRRPYLFVRGNHDSASLVQQLRGIAGVRVLDGSTTTVDGLTVYGVGDVFFTPDKSHIPDEEQRTDLVRAAASRVLADLEALPQPPDVVMIHNDVEASTAAGWTPLVISGHYHQFSTHEVDGTLFLRVGSTGGSGAGVFSQEGGIPLAAEIMYFDRTDGSLIGFDRVQQFPESGDVRLERHVVEDEFGTLVPSPAPTVSEPPSPSPTGPSGPSGPSASASGTSTSPSTTAPTTVPSAP